MLQVKLVITENNYLQGFAINVTRVYVFIHFKIDSAYT